MLESLDLTVYSALIDKIAEDLHSGKISPLDINQGLINQTYDDLNEGFAKGTGKYSFGKDAGADAAVLELQRNIYRFSHAKTLTELQEMNRALYDGDQIRSLSSFKEIVSGINAKYNRTWLETEYNTAKNSAEHARKWREYQEDKKLFPNLKYMTVGDGRVREEHAVLNGTIKPLDDPFWSKYYPPNGWNCRCYTVQTAEISTPGKVEDETVPKNFIGNVAKDNVIFSKENMFFQIANELQRNDTAIAFEISKTVATPELRYRSKSGAKVRVSPFTDTRIDELAGNYRCAVVLADKEKLNVDLMGKADGSILKKKPNPEYIVNGKIADRKSPTSKDYSKTLAKANRQKCKVVVYDLSRNEDTLENAANSINKLLSYTNKDGIVHPEIKEIYIISKDRKKVKYIKREKAN